MNCGHVKFEMIIRHPSEDVMEGVCLRVWDSRGNCGAGDTHLGEIRDRDSTPYDDRIAFPPQKSLSSLLLMPKVTALEIHLCSMDY